MVLVHLTQKYVFFFYDNEGDYWYSNDICKVGKHDGRGGFGLTQTELNGGFFSTQKKAFSPCSCTLQNRSNILDPQIKNPRQSQKPNYYYPTYIWV